MTAIDSDVLETLGRPEYPAAVQWSEDNLLAVVAGPGVIIVNPSQLRGPRASTVLPETSMSLLEADAYPADPQESCSYSTTYLRTRGMCQHRNSQIASSRLAVRSICWSPLGCDLPGNALLTSITENHQVRIHSPPPGCQTHWQTSVELSAKLKEVLQADKWQSIDKLQSCVSLTAQEHLRLRGGGGAGHKRSGDSKRKRSKGTTAEGAKADEAQQDSYMETNPSRMSTDKAQSSKKSPVLSHQFAVDDRIEVMNDEEGLQGSWFMGTITQRQHGFALVAYDELMVAEDSDEKLQEWFPLPGTPQANRALLKSTFDSHFGPGFKIRPPPPPEVAVRGLVRSMHDEVDALDDGGWWEGRVTQVGKQRYKVQPFISSSLLTVKKADVRNGVVWDGQGWSQRQSAGAKKETDPGRASSRKRKAQAAVESDDGEGGGNEDGDDIQGASDPGHPSTYNAEPYQVPPDFNPGCIAEVDDSTAEKLAYTLAVAVMERAHALRHQADAAVPAYSHGDALADSDSAIMERASAEVIHVHANSVKKAKYVTEQKVKRKARQLCCEYVFKNAASRSEHRPCIILPFKLPEDVKALLEGVKDLTAQVAQVAQATNQVAPKPLDG